MMPPNKAPGQRRVAVLRCYIGGHAGYGNTTSTSQYSAPETIGIEVGLTGTQLNESFDNKGFAGGGQAGCQLQTGMFLWGLEGDWSSFSNSSSRNFSKNYAGIDGDLITTNQNFNQSVSYDSLWSVRGRFGGIFSDVYHLYVTAGIGGAKANYAYSASFNEGGLMPVLSSCFCTSTAGNVGISPTGIVFGAGAEWKIWPQVVIGAEYLHYALYSDTALPLNTATLYSHGPFVGGFVGPGLGDHIHTNSVDVIRVRASYLFNWWNR